jgi:hypothetical protein
LGFISWALHRFVIRRYVEAKIPGLKNFLDSMDEPGKEATSEGAGSSAGGAPALAVETKSEIRNPKSEGEGTTNL